MPDEHLSALAEQVLLPHLDAAYNLARWLTGNEHDAEDVVQEAYLRACQFAGGFRGTEGRPWLLAIVRNTCYTWLERNRPRRPSVPFDEEQHGIARVEGQDRLVQAEERVALAKALEALPPEFREVIVLRELEGLSYREIAQVADIAVGTVMSRLARARERLQRHLLRNVKKEP